jgi:feruloyl esterase
MPPLKSSLKSITVQGDISMNHPVRPVLIVILLAVLAFVSIPAMAQQSCESLKSIKVPNITITSVESGGAGYQLKAESGFVNAPGIKVTAPFCRIQAFSAPTPDSHIGIEIWLPDAANWNGKFLAAGNPGFIGSLSSSGIAQMMQRGYVAAGTDTGHVDQGFEWAIGHPEKWADWGYRAVHEMAVLTKALAKAYYGKPIQHSYWNSCHNGGNQGLNEAQRYPEDFDGIVANDPAFYITHLQAGSLYISWVNLKDGVKAPGYISPAKIEVLHKAAIAACDGNDGLKDGLIEDPSSCKFDPVTIQCKGADAENCLTAAQVDTARKIYAGAKFKDGVPIYSGFERGSELNWNFMIEKEPFSVNTNYFKGMVFENKDWDFRTFDVDKDTRLAIQKTGKYVDGNNPDLKPFKKAGGKIIMVSSWNSLALPSRSYVEYYKSVEKAMGGRQQTQDFARMFAIPGGNGCVGFMGTGEDFNAFDAMQKWVEEGKAPDKIIVQHREAGSRGAGGMGGGGKVYRTRPVCPYPQVSKYKGSGDVNDAANFTCVEPGK